MLIQIPRGKVLLLLVTFSFTVMCSNALAQNRDSIMVTGAAAQRAVSPGDISGDAAAKIAQACQEFAVKSNFSAAIFVLDASGDIVHSHRMDGIRPFELDAALTRAKAAIFRLAANPQNTVNPNPNHVALMRGSLSRGFDPNPGGLAIVVNDKLIGAIGVAGSDNQNLDCARAGLAAVLPPPAPAAR
jgi:uncharacterized protein GlcG (DUF336 family)